ncbi:MAG TPA: hypothetical protein PKM20_08800 [Nitrosomonas sp.]|nr:hypothetical protein [Nitrosomonas sp.]HNP26826.1 hypothetical protein [Nitrosomonas sp.]
MGENPSPSGNIEATKRKLSTARFTGFTDGGAGAGNLAHTVSALPHNRRL